MFSYRLYLVYKLFPWIYLNKEAIIPNYSIVIISRVICIIEYFYQGLFEIRKLFYGWILVWSISKNLFDSHCTKGFFGTADAILRRM